jgi:RimJ/RimL family protein N-acetyltransferase
VSADGGARPVLETTRLRLRPPTLADAGAIERMVGDVRVAEMTASIPHPYPAGGAAEFIRSLATAAAIDLAVERKADGAVIGMASLRPLDGWRVAELGYYIGVPYWRRGYATEAAQRLVDYGFAALGVERFANHVFAGNRASARVMEKLGHRRSGEGEVDYPLRGRRRVWHFELLRPVTP